MSRCSRHSMSRVLSISTIVLAELAGAADETGWEY